MRPVSIVMNVTT